MMENMLKTSKERDVMFEVLFLKEGKNQSVEIEESRELDFNSIKAKIFQERSVFITRKFAQKFTPRMPIEKLAREVSKKDTTP